MALVQKELVQLRWVLAALTASALGLAVGVWLCGNTFGDKAAGLSLQFYQYLITPLFAAMVPSQSLQQEEKNGGFHYLRSLPVTPAAIVGAKHLIVSLIAVGVPALFLGADLLGGSYGTLVTWTVVAGASLTLGGVVLFLGFLTGARGVMVSLFLLVLGLNLATMFALSESGLGASLRALQSFLGTPVGAVTAIGAGATIMVLGYFGSVAIFSRRDITRLP